VRLEVDVSREVDDTHGHAARDAAPAVVADRETAS